MVDFDNRDALIDWLAHDLTMAARILGRRGGLAGRGKKTVKQATASRANLAKARAIKRATKEGLKPAVNGVTSEPKENDHDQTLE